MNFNQRKDKRNREQGAENLPLPSLTVPEAQYSLNLQQQERENAVTRSNILTNEVSQQQVDNIWEEAHSSFRLPSVVNDEHPFQNSRFSFLKIITFICFSLNRLIKLNIFIT